ncbi:lipase family protein [Photorhabdus heterorhabditis]|uniref:lipase family protein n=1 Tax=Photorhabdus heterorhabditis TaxID=880156 RepID=UPI0015621026|nr:lipase family protein [Photorhabdus heterorhabditis]NRN27937.1 phospholipase [Photorhabdus heterorhabditis subsp. aluminescens]
MFTNRVTTLHLLCESTFDKTFKKVNEAGKVKISCLEKLIKGMKNFPDNISLQYYRNITKSVEEFKRQNSDIFKLKDKKITETLKQAEKKLFPKARNEKTLFNQNIQIGAAKLSSTERCIQELTDKRHHNVHHHLASHYTSTGLDTKVSLGKVLTTTLKYLTLNAPARRIGTAIQRGYDSHAQSAKGKARYWTGAIIKGLANIMGGASSVISGAISVGVAGVKNLAEFTGRLLVSSALGLAGAVMKGISYLPPGVSDRLQASMRAEKWLNTAKVFIKPAFVAKAEQEPLNVAEARAVMDTARLARISCSSSYRDMPTGYSHATLADIPSSILACREDGSGGTGKKLTLRVRPGKGKNDPLILKGDAWSALKVAVYKRDDTVVLSFVGTQPTKRPGTIKSDVCAALGIKDSAFQDADRLVKAFTKQYGNKVEVLGHSLGGGLAQYAGIKHGIKVTVFNSMGLHVGLRDRLADKLDSANVTHINTSNDPLSQKVEHGIWGLDACSQVGKRYVIEHSGGHRMESVTAGLEALLA